MGNKVEICCDDNLSYVGQIKNQKFYGKGTLYYNDSGDLYKGSFKDGLKHGHGELKYYNGDKYIGEFYQDHQHGKGHFITNNGFTYVGNFTLNSLLGKGQIYNNFNNLIYEGDFLNNLPHGFGISYVNGEILYVGNWNENFYNGYGLLIENNVNKYGLFQEGILIEQINMIPHKFLKFIKRNKEIYDSNINISKYTNENKIIFPTFNIPTAPPLEDFTKQISVINPVVNLYNGKNNDNIQNYKTNKSEPNEIKSIFNPMNIR
jgi:hypothetical protein